MFNNSVVSFFLVNGMGNSVFSKNSSFVHSCWTNTSFIYFFRGRSLVLFPQKIKVELTGKVFKWSFSPKVWKFSVHYSHISDLVFRNNIFFFKRVGKKWATLFSKKVSYFFFFKIFLKKIRYSDLFTSRGVVYSPRLFLKKQGKISTYV